MHFASRDLKTHAEPVTPEGLVVGELYFSVQFNDQDMLAPEVEALVFLGNDLDPGAEGMGHYFQDAGSFLAGARYGFDAKPNHGSGDELEACIYQQAHGQVKHIFEFERALDELLKCSLRRAALAEVKYRRIEPGRPTRG